VSTPERPNCARLSAERYKTEIIHAFLVEVAEKGVGLVQHTPSHYLDSDTGDRAETVYSSPRCLVRVEESDTSIGTEGQALDALLYAFIGVDPKELEKERRTLLDSLGG